MVLRRWKGITRESGISNWVGNVNWPPLRISKLIFRALAFRQSKWINTLLLFDCDNTDSFFIEIQGPRGLNGAGGDLGGIVSWYLKGWTQVLSLWPLLFFVLCSTNWAMDPLWNEFCNERYFLEYLWVWGKVIDRGGTKALRLNWQMPVPPWIPCICHFAVVVAIKNF